MVKNSCGAPFREVPIFIIFFKGVDDVRGNLWWRKQTLGAEKFDCFDKEYAGLTEAVAYIEAMDYEGYLRDKTIELWNSIDQHFQEDVKPKVRF